MSTPDTIQPTTTQYSNRSRWVRTAVCLAACLVGIWAWVLFIRPDQFSRAGTEGGSPASPSAIVAVAEPSVEELQKKMVKGIWEDHYQGHRLLTIREDGTAEMVVELTGLGALLVAPRMEFDIEWTISQGCVTLQTTAGRPEKKTRAILKLHGDQARYHLDLLEENRLVLRDAKSGKLFEWKRLTPEEAAKSTTTTRLASEATPAS